MIKKIARLILGFPIWAIITLTGLLCWFFIWLFDVEDEFLILGDVVLITKKWLSIDTDKKLSIP